MVVSGENVDSNARVVPTIIPSVISNSTQPSFPVEEEPFCKLILYIEISNSR